MELRRNYTREDVNYIVDKLLNGKEDKRKKIEINRFEKEYIESVELSKSSAYISSIVLAFKHLKHFFSPAFNLGEIGEREVERFIANLKRTAPGGVYVYYRNLQAAFNRAKDWGYIRENPFEKVKLPKRQKNKPHFITEEQLKNICKIILGEN